MSRRLVTFGLIALAALFFLVPLALDIPLIDPDEGLHAAIAQEMADGGRYLVPTFLGEPFLDKPILFFWAQALSLKIFGMNEAAVRFPGLIFGLLGAVSTGLVGDALLGRRVGVLSGCFYTTMLMPLAQSQAAGPDVALISWINLAVLFIWKASTRQSARRAAVLAGVFLGLAILTKGLVGAALLCLIFGGLHLARGSWRRIAPTLGLALIVAFALASPWYLALERARPGYLWYYFVDRHLLGYLATGQRHGDSPFWYYAPILAGGGLPWIAYLPPAIAERWRAGSATGRREPDLLWIWLAAGFLFFSLGSSKLATYLLPVFPAAAILVADVWSRLLEGQDSRTSGLLKTGGVVHLVVVALLVPVAMLAIRDRYEIVFSPYVWFAAGLPAAGSLAVAGRWNRRGIGAILPGALGLSAATFFIAIAFLLPPVAASTSGEDLAAHLNRLGSLPSQVWIIEDRVGSVVFYLEPRLRSRLTPSTFRTISIAAATHEIADAGPDVVVAVRDRRVKSFEQAVKVHVPTGGRGEFHLLSPAH